MSLMTLMSMMAKGDKMMNKTQAKALLDRINWELNNEELSLEWFISILDQYALLE